MNRLISSSIVLSLAFVLVQSFPAWAQNVDTSSLSDLQNESAYLMKEIKKLPPGDPRAEVLQKKLDQDLALIPAMNQAYSQTNEAFAKTYGSEEYKKLNDKEWSGQPLTAEEKRRLKEIRTSLVPPSLALPAANVGETGLYQSDNSYGPMKALTDRTAQLNKLVAGFKPNKANTGYYVENGIVKYDASDIGTKTPNANKVRNTAIRAAATAAAIAENPTTCTPKGPNTQSYTTMVNASQSYVSAEAQRQAANKSRQAAINEEYKARIAQAIAVNKAAPDIQPIQHDTLAKRAAADVTNASAASNNAQNLGSGASNSGKQAGGEGAAQGMEMAMGMMGQLMGLITMGIGATQMASSCGPCAAKVIYQMRTFPTSKTVWQHLKDYYHCTIGMQSARADDVDLSAVTDIIPTTIATPKPLSLGSGSPTLSLPTDFSSLGGSLPSTSPVGTTTTGGLTGTIQPLGLGSSTSTITQPTDFGSLGGSLPTTPTGGLTGTYESLSLGSGAPTLTPPADFSTLQGTVPTGPTVGGAGAGLDVAPLTVAPPAAGSSPGSPPASGGGDPCATCASGSLQVAQGGMQMTQGIAQMTKGKDDPSMGSGGGAGDQPAQGSSPSTASTATPPQYDALMQKYGSAEQQKAATAAKTADLAKLEAARKANIALGRANTDSAVKTPINITANPGLVGKKVSDCSKSGSNPALGGGPVALDDVNLHCAAYAAALSELESSCSQPATRMVFASKVSGLANEASQEAALAAKYLEAKTNGNIILANELEAKMKANGGYASTSGDVFAGKTNSLSSGQAGISTDPLTGKSSPSDSGTGTTGPESTGTLDVDKETGLTIVDLNRNAGNLRDAIGLAMVRAKSSGAILSALASGQVHFNNISSSQYASVANKVANGEKLTLEEKQIQLSALNKKIDSMRKKFVPVKRPTPKASGIADANIPKYQSAGSAVTQAGLASQGKALQATEQTGNNISEQQRAQLERLGISGDIRLDIFAQISFRYQQNLLPVLLEGTP